jgi:hypothetical protein
MGANAVTTVPVYVAGEVLTAGDLNITNSGIPVFASTVERDAAFGGTGEKTLAEGQFAYLETGNVTQYYDGAAWQPVGVSPGLVLVGSASPSAVSSISINNCFTSTYQNYRIVFALTAATGATAALNMRLRASGTDTSTNYVGQLFEAYSATSTSTLNPQGTDEWNVANLVPGQLDSAFAIDVYRPQTATKTAFSGLSTVNYPSPFVLQMIGGVQTDNTQFDGATFSFASTNFSGNIRVYGYANS